MIPTKKTDRYFFLAFALYFLITQAIGFSHSSVERVAKEGGLPTIAIIHGTVGALWYMLFAVQAALITKKNIRLHQRLGQVSVPLVVAVFLTGIYAIFRVNTPTEDIPFDLMKSEVGLFTLGLIYATLGYRFRRRPHDHKRYYLMSMIMLSPAGIARLMDAIGFQPSHVVVYILILFVVPLLTILAYDFFAYKKIFRGTLIGIGIYVLNLVVGSFWGGLVVDYIRPIFL